MAMRQFLMCCASSLVLFGFGDAPTPKEAPSNTYDRYYKLVSEGRTFKQDVVFHTSKRRAKMAKETPAKAKRMGKSTEEYQALYLKFTQRLARCGSLSLLTEKIEGKTANLVYAVKDICTDSKSNNQLFIGMVYEDGWKIQSDLLKVKS